MNKSFKTQVVSGLGDNIMGRCDRCVGISNEIFFKADHIINIIVSGLELLQKKVSMRMSSVSQSQSFLTTA